MKSHNADIGGVLRMFYFDTAGQITLLVSLCFPFCILAFSIWFKNAETLPRLLGFAFWSPLLLNAASFMVVRKAASQSFAAVSELALLLCISLLVLLRPAKRNFSMVQAVLWLFPVLALILINYLPALQNFLSGNLNTLPVLIVLVLLNMYLLKKEKGPESILFWTMLPIAAGGLAGLMPDTNVYRYAAPVFKLAAYVMFTAYFHKVYLKDILKKISEADRKITAANRSIDYEVKKRVLEIERVNQNLVNISKTDSLSKTLNKVALLDFIENMILTRPKNEFSIIMFDIDDFKTINDTLGHISGDKCIKTLSTLAKSNLREVDVIGRYGGDEFIIVLPGANTAQALMIAERFRKKIETTEVPHFTISVGIATYPDDGSTTKQLIEAADDSMYVSKANGKNTVSHKSTG